MNKFKDQSNYDSCQMNAESTKDSQSNSTNETLVHSSKYFQFFKTIVNEKQVVIKQLKDSQSDEDQLLFREHKHIMQLDQFFTNNLKYHNQRQYVQLAQMQLGQSDRQVETVSKYMSQGNLKHILNQVNKQPEDIKYKFQLLIISELLNCVQILSLAGIKVFLDENSFLFDVDAHPQTSRDKNSPKNLLDIKVAGFSESIRNEATLIENLSTSDWQLYLISYITINNQFDVNCSDLMTQTKHREFVLLLLKYSDLDVGVSQVLSMDQFKQFLRKELVEKYKLPKESFYTFREELAKMFREQDLNGLTDKIKVSNSFKDLRDVMTFDEDDQEESGMTGIPVDLNLKSNMAFSADYAVSPLNTKFNPSTPGKLNNEKRVKTQQMKVMKRVTCQDLVGETPVRRKLLKHQSESVGSDEELNQDDLDLVSPKSEKIKIEDLDSSPSSEFDSFEQEQRVPRVRRGNPKTINQLELSVESF